MAQAASKDALTAALRQIMVENGLTRIDIGAYPDRALVTVWFDAPGDVVGCATGSHSDSTDAAIDGALSAMRAKLANARMIAA